MTEQTTENTPSAHQRLVEEIVREILGALHTSDSEAEGGFGSQREAVEGDLKRLDPEELGRQFSDAARVLEGFVNAAEGINVVTLAVLSDCRNRVRAAHRRAKVVAGMELNPFD